MERCFIFKPCKADDSFKLVPKCKVDREKLVKNIVGELNGEIVANTSFITIVKIGKIKITVSKKGEIIVRNVNDSDMEILSTKIMRLV
ncbi:MAG: hypothetical protein GF368_04660 [Candidatus Aenigmarchaeota archaeon]|nr:hypothetical protein [Candidatus Aenigmarchaeota archaeon]